MRETVVRRVFGAVSTAFLEWMSGSAIAAHAAECMIEARRVFNHAAKVQAVADVAEHVGLFGFDRVREAVMRDGIEFLESLPFIGPITRFHLAKNLGMDVVKPDRHLVRYASATGFDSPDALCREIAQLTGERLSVIDLVLWRYATLNPEYLKALG